MSFFNKKTMTPFSDIIWVAKHLNYPWKVESLWTQWNHCELNYSISYSIQSIFTF